MNANSPEVIKMVKNWEECEIEPGNGEILLNARFLNQICAIDYLEYLRTEDRASTWRGNPYNQSRENAMFN
jgi:hypothetical protein